MEYFKKDKKDSLECVRNVKKDVCRYFEPFKKLLKDEEELYYGIVWKNIREFRPFENNVFDIIETAVPILSDNLPSPSVTVKDPRKKEQAKVLEKRIEKANKDQDWSLKYPDVIRNSLQTGTGWVHPYYDHDAKNGQGMEIYEVLDWGQVKVSSRSNDIRECDKARIELKRTRGWLCEKYPKFEKQLKNVKAKEDYEDDDGDRGLEKVDSGGTYARRFVPEDYRDDDTLCLVLTYKKDYSLEKIPREETAEQIQEAIEAIESQSSPESSKYQDHEAFIMAFMEYRKELMMSLGLDPMASFDDISLAVEELAEYNPEAAPQFESSLLTAKLIDDAIEDHKTLQKINPKGGRPKYPGGYRVIESVDKITLYDGKNKHEHGFIPIVPFYCYRNKSIYGISMIRHIADSQRMQAVQGFAEYKGLQKVSNPEKEVNKASGLTKDDISNEPGAIYEVKEDTRWSVRNLEPGRVSEQGVRFQEMRVDKMREISGMTDPTRGELPDGRLSEVTVMKTQTQALGRMRLKDRQYQYFSLKLLAQMVASDIIQNESSEMVLEIEENDGEYNEVIFNPIELSDLEYDIEISSDTMAGLDKDAFNMYATSLLNQQHITFKQYAQIVDVPRVEKLREFADENDQVQSQVQQVGQELEAVKIENIKLKASLDPSLLTPEEVKIFQEIQREEQLAAIGGPNEGQPLA